MQRASAIFAGAGIGLLLGAIVGLSVSSVVGSVVGGLVALLATFLGLKDDATTASEDRAWGVGTFGILCVIGIIGGVVLRTHDVLAPSVSERVQTWVAAGYAKSDALNIVALKDAGLVPPGAKTQQPIDHNGTVLFAADTSVCDQLRPADYADAANLARALTIAGGPWKDFAEATSAIRDAKIRMQVLSRGWALVCR